MPKRIMLVDDERDLTNIFHQMLGNSGHEVVEVANGSDVYRRVLAEHFDLVLLDYHLRDIKGDKVCEIIRSDEALKDLPVIIVTGYRNLDEAFFKAIGANEVLYKPVHREDLVRAVEKYLGETL